MDKQNEKKEYDHLATVRRKQVVTVIILILIVILAFAVNMRWHSKQTPENNEETAEEVPEVTVTLEVEKEEPDSVSADKKELNEEVPEVTADKKDPEKKPDEKKEDPEEDENQEETRESENSQDNSETEEEPQEIEPTMQIYKVPVDVMNRFPQPENLASSLARCLSTNGLEVITATYVGNEWESDEKFCFDLALPDDTIVRVQYNYASGNFMFSFVEE